MDIKKLIQSLSKEELEALQHEIDKATEEERPHTVTKSIIILDDTQKQTLQKDFVEIKQILGSIDTSEGVVFLKEEFMFTTKDAKELYFSLTI